MFAPMLIPGILFFAVICLISEGLRRTLTLKKALVIIGVAVALVAFCIGYFAIWMNKTFTWREGTYNKSSGEVTLVLDEPVADLIETYYYFPHGWSSGDTKEHWYQTGWYESVEDLAEVMSFEDDESINLFVSSVDSSNVVTTFLKSDLYEVPANENRDVTYYEVDYEELGLKTPEYGNPIGYFVVVDNDTQEASLVAYYVYAYRYIE